MAAILNRGREGVIKDRQGKFCNRGKFRRRKKSLGCNESEVAKKTESSVTSSEFGDAFRLSGRRFVVLEVLAEALDGGWKVCNTPLQLSSCTDETLSGLGSFLYIICSNSECGKINVCHTNMTHRVAGTTRERPIFYVNTKIAAG